MWCLKNICSKHVLGRWSSRLGSGGRSVWEPKIGFKQQLLLSSQKTWATARLNAYHARSKSRVDDLFVGLFKSVVRCPDPKCVSQLSGSFQYLKMMFWRFICSTFFNILVWTCSAETVAWFLRPLFNREGSFQGAEGHLWPLTPSCLPSCPCPARFGGLGGMKISPNAGGVDLSCPKIRSKISPKTSRTIGNMDFWMVRVWFPAVSLHSITSAEALRQSSGRWQSIWWWSLPWIAGLWGCFAMQHCDDFLLNSKLTLKLPVEHFEGIFCTGYNSFNRGKKNRDAPQKSLIWNSS